MEAAIIAAIIGIIGSIVSVAYDSSKNSTLTGAQQEQNTFNAEQAQINREWQEAMIEKYQTPQAQVQNYKAAGLNPALMYGGVSAPSAISGAQASGSSPAYSSIMASIIPSLLSSVLDTSIRSKELDIKDDVAKADVNKTNAEIRGIEIDNENKQRAADDAHAESVSRTDLNNLELSLKPLREEIQRKLNVQAYDFNAERFEVEMQKGRLEVKQLGALILKTQSEICNLKQSTLESISREDLNRSTVLLQSAQRALIASQDIKTIRESESIELDNFVKMWRKEIIDNEGWDPEIIERGNTGLIPLVSRLASPHVEKVWRSFLKSLEF